MNSAVRPIFNESFVKKRYLWVLWTIHRTHWKSINFAETCFTKKKKKKTRTQCFSALSKWILSMHLAKFIFVNLFHYSIYFCYYLWVLLYFLILFTSLAILFQLTFAFIYVTFSKKFQFQRNKQISTHT